MLDTHSRTILERDIERLRRGEQASLPNGLNRNAGLLRERRKTLEKRLEIDSNERLRAARRRAFIASDQLDRAKREDNQQARGYYGIAMNMALREAGELAAAVEIRPAVLA